MSALSTSVVNKSSKKLAPKAPAQRRRPQAPAPTPPLSTAESRQSVSDNERGEPASKRQRLESGHHAPEVTSTQQPAIPTPPPTQQTSAQSTTASAPAPASDTHDVPVERASSVVSNASNRSRRGATSIAQDVQPTRGDTPSTALSTDGNRRRRQPASRASDPPDEQGRASQASASRRTLAAASSQDSINTRAGSQSQTEQEQSQPTAGQVVGESSTVGQESDAAEPVKRTSTRTTKDRAGKGRQAQKDSVNSTQVATQDNSPSVAEADDAILPQSRTRSTTTKKTTAKQPVATQLEIASPTSRRGRSRRTQPSATDSTEESAAGHPHNLGANQGEGPVDAQALPGAAHTDTRRTRASRSRKTAGRADAVVELPSTPRDGDAQAGNSQVGDQAEADEAEEQAGADEAEGQAGKTKKPRRQRERAATPEDAENHQIDAATVTMTALTRDTRQGKKSKVEAAMQEIDWADVARKRKEAEERAYEHGELERSEQEVNARLDRAGEQSAASSAPRTKIVNGQIVIDTASLVVDRHAAAAADSANQPVEELEETDLTSHVTSHSWVHDSRRDPEERRLMKMKSDPWSKQQTNEFYKALSMFGTDFFIISKMFPGKTRRQIKLKFVREERSDPARINAAVLGEHTTPMDIGAYGEATGRGEDYYKDPQQLQAELQDEEERQKREIEQQREEQEQAQRDKQRRAAEKSAAAQRERAAKRAAGSNKRKGKGGTGAATEPGPGAEGVEVAVEPAPDG